MSIRGARLSAAQLARRISMHHQGCTVCQRGGRVVLGPGGARRVRCDIDRRLFELLGLAAEEGWPRAS